MRKSKQLLANWIVLATYVVVVIFLASRHEPWGDEYKVWHMTYSMSLGELIRSMRVEGHFCLWHLCVLPWVKFLGVDYHALFVASISLMTIATWLLLFKVDFPFIGKLFIIFSAPFIYHFPVIARCYALIPPIVIGIVAVYQQKKSPFLYCFLVGLLAHTHAYMEGLVAILWILFVYHYVIKIWNTDIQRAKRNLKASSITVVLVILAFLQIVGSVVDAGNGVGPAFKSSISDDYWVGYFFSYHRIRLFKTIQLHIWEDMPNFDLSITLLAYFALVWYFSGIVSAQCKASKREYLFIIGVSAIWQVFFATNIYNMSFQRVYLLCVPVLMVVGIAYSESVKKYCSYVVMLFWLISTPCQYVIVKDITQEYNFDARCALELESVIPEKAEIFTTGEVSCIRLMKRHFKQIDGSRNIEFTRTEIPCFLITTQALDTFSHKGYDVQPIYRGVEGNGEISGIQYESPFTLYLIKHEKGN